MKDEARKMPGILSTRGTEEMCAACGEKFECGATLAECWCSEVKLSEQTRAALKERYKGCLCRECLEKIAARGLPEAK